MYSLTVVSFLVCIAAVRVFEQDTFLFVSNSVCHFYLVLYTLMIQIQFCCTVSFQETQYCRYIFVVLTCITEYIVLVEYAICFILCAVRSIHFGKNISFISQQSVIHFFPTVQHRPWPSLNCSSTMFLVLLSTMPNFIKLISVWLQYFLLERN